MRSRLALVSASLASVAVVIVMVLVMSRPHEMTKAEGTWCVAHEEIVLAIYGRDGGQPPDALEEGSLMLWLGGSDDLMLSDAKKAAIEQACSDAYAGST
ncbi:MAG TPA: hypothetical protein VFL75_05455 [Candidatus Limnocylindria bacterium]|jgi:hypothetical protein|nr:hypothetical protein [Candidatus Limnocylindria bacterium]